MLMNIVHERRRRTLRRRFKSPRRKPRGRLAWPCCSPTSSDGCSPLYFATLWATPPPLLEYWVPRSNSQLLRSFTMSWAKVAGSHSRCSVSSSSNSCASRPCRLLPGQSSLSPATIYSRSRASGLKSYHSRVLLSWQSGSLPFGALP